MVIIKGEDAKQFIRDFNKNVVSEDFLESCKKAGRLFGRKNRYD